MPNIPILSRFKSTFGVNERNRKLHRENYFSKQFLKDTLQDVGFKSVEVLTPTEEGAIHLGAKLFDERGNLFEISVHHLGNMLNFSAQPADIDKRIFTSNVNRISITITFQKKYIVMDEESGTIFGNQSQVDLFRECNSKANLFFEDLKDEFERRGKRFAK